MFDEYFLYDGVVLKAEDGEFGRVDALFKYESKKAKKEKSERDYLKKLIKEAVIEVLNENRS